MQALVGGRDRRHLKLVPGSEQAPTVKRLPPAVADHTTRLPQAQPRGGEVVGRVVEHLAVADALELRAHPWNLLYQPRAHLDHRVELAGHDARHREGLRAELERSATDRRTVDQVAEHLDGGTHGPAAEAIAPEHAVRVLVGAQVNWPR